MLLSLVLIGLIIVGNYTYFSIRHDMVLMTTKQPNVFEVFYQRARILTPAMLRQFIEQSDNKQPIFSGNYSALAFVYGYEIESRERFAAVPIVPSAEDTLNTYQYVLSYPAVINLYAIFNDGRLYGMMADNRRLQPRLPSANPRREHLTPWYHYFGCPAYTRFNSLCSNDEAMVSDIYTATFTRQRTITMFFPFNFYDSLTRTYRYGLTGIDIAVDIAFKQVLKPYETLNPTRTIISFDAVEPCRPYHLCLSTPLKRSPKVGIDLYLKWSYSYADFLKVALSGPAFKIYLISLLLLTLCWRKLSLSLRKLAHIDKLTKLPRRDILDQPMMQSHDYLMILDIDNFKSINDTYGHNVGDKALIAFANQLRTRTRSADIAIRWGGEEFIVLYKGLSGDDDMCNTVARLLARPLQIEEVPNPITFSAGIVRIHNYLTVTDVINQADELLYHVKQHGKHNIAFYRDQHIQLVREPGLPPAM